MGWYRKAQESDDPIGEAVSDFFDDVQRREAMVFNVKRLARDRNGVKTPDGDLLDEAIAREIDSWGPDRIGKWPEKSDALIAAVAVASVTMDPSTISSSMKWDFDKLTAIAYICGAIQEWKKPIEGLAEVEEEYDIHGRGGVSPMTAGRTALRAVFKRRPDIA